MAGSFYSLRPEQVSYAPMDVSGYLNVALKGFNQAGEGLKGLGKQLTDIQDARYLTGLAQQKDYASMQNWLNSDVGRELANSASLETAKAGTKFLQDQILVDKYVDNLSLNKAKDLAAQYYADLFDAEQSGNRAKVNAVQQRLANNGYGDLNGYLGRIFTKADPLANAKKLQDMAQIARANRQQDIIYKASAYSKAAANQRLAELNKAYGGNFSNISPDLALEIATLKKVAGLNDIGTARDLIEETAKYDKEVAANTINLSKQSQEALDEFYRRLDPKNSGKIPTKPVTIKTISPDTGEEVEMTLPPGSGTIKTDEAEFLGNLNSAGISLPENARDANKMYDFFNTALSPESISALPVEKQAFAKAARDFLKKQPFIQSAYRVLGSNMSASRNLHNVTKEGFEAMRASSLANMDESIKAQEANLRKKNIPLEAVAGYNQEIDAINTNNQTLDFIASKVPEKEKAAVVANIKNAMDDIRENVPDASPKEIAAALLDSLVLQDFFSFNTAGELILGKRHFDKDKDLSLNVRRAKETIINIRNNKAAIDNLKQQRINAAILAARLNAVTPDMFNGTTDLDRMYYMHKGLIPAYNAMTYYVPQK